MKPTAATEESTAAANWRYAAPAVALHWILAVLITGMAAVGWYMVSIEDQPGSDWYFDTHKSTGLVVAALVAARLAWRLTHRPRPLPASVPAWQDKLSGITHLLLYVLMVLMPVTGYLGASYSKYGVPFFGADTPHWAAVDKDTSELLFTVHSVLVWVLAALVAIHVAGGLRHLLLRDGVFERMGLRSRPLDRPTD